MQNTITIQSAAYSALTFAINEAGECIGSYWQTDKENRIEASERAVITEQEAALYFDAQGVLDLSKWLAIHQERKAAYEAQDAIVWALDEKMTALLGHSPEPSYMAIEDHGESEPLRLIPSSQILSREDIATTYEAWESGAGLCGQFGPVGGTIRRKSDGKPFPMPKAEALHVYWQAYKDFEIKHGLEKADLHCEHLNDLQFEAAKCVCLAPARSLQQLAIKTELVAEFCNPDNGITGFERIILKGLARDTVKLAHHHLHDEAA